jgi:hypothetical protein
MAGGWQSGAMKKLLIALLILGGCSRGQDGQGGGNASGQPGGASASAPGTPGRIGTLMGLYEGGDVSPKNQLCMVENEGEQPRFGLVVWGSNQNSCSGSGTAERNGERLQLKMTGDESCTIEARISGKTVILPEKVPDGCAYYCGANARLTAARFDQVGTGRDDAVKAEDLVGDPLC